MLTAVDARQIAMDSFELDRAAIASAISEAAHSGQFRVVFDYRRWSGARAERWLEGLGYEITNLWMLAPEAGNELEVSWLSAE